MWVLNDFDMMPMIPLKKSQVRSAFSMKHFEAPHRAIACHNRSMNPQRPCCKGRYAAYQIQASDEVVPVLGGKKPLYR